MRGDQIQVRVNSHGEGYASGNDQNLPAAINRLPFDLWRSHEYPGPHPEVIERGAEEYLANQPMPVMSLPQRMGFTRWKTPPYVLGWGSNVMALVEAVTNPQLFAARLAAIGQGHAPSESMRAAALERSSLPQVSDNVSPEIDSTEVLPRNALPTYRTMMTTQELESVAAQHERQATANNVNRIARRDAAVEDAAALAQVGDSFYASRGDGRDDIPWFLEV